MDLGGWTGPGGLALGHHAINEIGQHAQAVSPRNYEIWLTYVTNSHPALRNAIDQLVASGGAFDEETLDALYQQHFTPGRLTTEVLETGSRIAHEIADALDALQIIAVHSGHYGETLDMAANKLRSAAADPTQVRQLVSVLASATNEMSTHNATLSEKLAQSSAEMEHLRAALKEAKAQALTDGLTGVANRKLFDETLRLREKEARNGDGDLTLVLCDIDHFKKFNDTWGHQTGDQVIRMVATALAKAAKPDHLVARYGGEEFAIVMPRTPLKQAAQLAENVRVLIHSKRLVRKTTQESIGHVSVSFGVATLRSSEELSRLVSRADECLYLSKRLGRNRVSLESELDRAA